ncbi:hypothetical protein ACRALDRAFT_212840 [Sodiomyces alcalophilus JCM 7366]|uniref:uncharacterized protein n=1 Tax=Sodiomyces alcalophilus JCM 7366 TaxID=591952 RepID=UPI0039B44011
MVTVVVSGTRRQLDLLLPSPFPKAAEQDSLDGQNRNGMRTEERMQLADGFWDRGEVGCNVTRWFGDWGKGRRTGKFLEVAFFEVGRHLPLSYSSCASNRTHSGSREEASSLSYLYFAGNDTDAASWDNNRLYAVLTYVDDGLFLLLTSYARNVADRSRGESTIRARSKWAMEGQDRITRRPAAEGT